MAVASGAPCLRRFAVHRPGRVLLYAAEDALHVVRHRLDGICQAADVALERLDVQVITTPHLRLDRADDAQRLANTVADLRPRLLVLDPFVRLHRLDENASGDVASLLGLLRDLQRQHLVAVVVVHHAKKGGGGIRAGQALRGSSEFHAWGDSLLYLRRQGDRLTLAAEHRAAPGIETLALRLRTDDDQLALELVEKHLVPEPTPSLPPPERIRQVLAATPAPLGLGALRAACQIRKATLCRILAEMTQRGEIHRTESGYALAPSA